MITGCTSIERVLTLDEAIRWSSISLMITDTDITVSCSYSWSPDKNQWSCWSDYNTYKRICSTLDSDYYLRIRFKTQTVPSLYINNVLVSECCYSITLYLGNPFLINPCNILESSGFDLYCGWECAMQMQQQLSDQVICMVGIPIFYFRVQPDASTKSYTFKEYVMHGVESVKQLKMMIPDGTMPSSKPTLTEWDLEFETDWETELSKTQFATAFGTDAFPKQRDFIWVPLQKRMYMVNTAYDEKNEGLMWQATTWKLALVKWQDQSNIDTTSIESMLDDLIVNNYSDVFERGEHREGELTGTIQLESPRTSANNIYNITNSDHTRSAITIDKMKIVDRQINHESIIVTKNKYIFTPDSEIHYQKGWCGSEGTLSLIFDFQKNTDDDEIKNIITIGNWKLNFQRNPSNQKLGYLIFEEKNIEITLGETYMCVVRWGRQLGQTSLCIYKQIYPDDVPSFKLKPTMFKFDFENGQTESTKLDERLISSTEVPAVLHGYPLQVASVKLYNRYIDYSQFEELLKYTTKDEYCIINDQARPLNTGLGYSVR